MHYREKLTLIYRDVLKEQETVKILGFTDEPVVEFISDLKYIIKLAENTLVDNNYGTTEGGKLLRKVKNVSINKKS